MTDAAPAITPKQRKRTQEIAADWKAAGPKFKAAVVALNEAVVTGDLMGMKEGCRKMQAQLSEVSNIAAQAAFVIKSLNDLAAQAGFADPAGDAVVMREQLDAVAEAASTAFAAGKRLVEKAEKAIDDAEKGGADFEKKWAKANAYLEVHCGYRPAALKQVLAIVEAARKAVEARDAKALDKAKKDAAGFQKFAVSIGKLREVLEIRRGTLGEAPEADRKSYEADLATWAQRIRTAEADEVQIGLEKETVADLAIEPRDAKKAAAVLGIAGGDVQKLAKVLDGEPSLLMKGLEALRRQLALAMPAKDMLLALQKARLV